MVPLESTVLMDPKEALILSLSKDEGRATGCQMLAGPGT